MPTETFPKAFKPKNKYNVIKGLRFKLDKTQPENIKRKKAYFIRKLIWQKENRIVLCKMKAYLQIETKLEQKRNQPIYCHKKIPLRPLGEGKNTNIMFLGLNVGMK